MSTDDHRVGYRNPPRHSRFTKGRSGNPNGRPKGRHRALPHETVLGQQVTIRENGAERRVTAGEAFLLQLVKRGLEGDPTAASLAMAALDAVRTHRSASIGEPITIIRLIGAGGVSEALESLRMARILHRDQPNARCRLEPWIVEAALARLATPLTVAEQVEVLSNTRTPHKVRWPEWWSVKVPPRTV